MIPCGNLILRPWASIDPARPAVVADMIDRDVIYLLFVNIVDILNIDVGYVAVVEEMSAIPASANKAEAEIAKAVVDSAIKADMRPPIAVIEKPPTVGPCPIRWRPEKTDFRS